MCQLTTNNYFSVTLKGLNMNNRGLHSLQSFAHGQQINNNPAQLQRRIEIITFYAPKESKARKKISKFLLKEQ
jgi:hypothetical protein